MKDQLDVAIRAVLTAKHEISKLKQKLESDDARLDLVDDADMGMGWIVKRLQELGQSKS